MTPGKVANFTEPEVVAEYPRLREQWHAVKPGDKNYSMPRSVRGDFAVVEVADRDASLLPDTMAADKAIRLIQQRAKQKQPFFLAVGFVRPHFPFISTESSLRPYDPETTALPKFPSDDQVDMPAQAIAKDMNLADDAVRQLRRGYYGAVSFMDEQFGRLMDELDRLKLRDNTIVVFVSDHGYLLGEHRMWKKTLLWEEAIRTPLIISAPGRARGVRCNRVVELVDLYPTLAELAGLPRSRALKAKASCRCSRIPRPSSRGTMLGSTPAAATACVPSAGRSCGIRPSATGRRRSCCTI